MHRDGKTFIAAWALDSKVQSGEEIQRSHRNLMHAGCMLKSRQEGRDRKKMNDPIQSTMTDNLSPSLSFASLPLTDASSIPFDLVARTLRDKFFPFLTVFLLTSPSPSFSLSRCLSLCFEKWKKKRLKVPSIDGCSNRISLCVCD